jgi:2-amino-4-hydroxy-6-hydroxymethyldihydropteridine diphosphokinase
VPVTSKFVLKFFMESVYLLLGSNLGDRLENINHAHQQISRVAGRVITGSSIYKTAAWGKTDQPDFLNQVVLIETSLSPFDALAQLQQIERSSGRTPSEKWDARILDIDILFWGNQVINEPGLKVPHPGIPERKFTLIPLHEINPHLIHPLNGKTIAELLRECTDPLPVELLENSTAQQPPLRE